MVRIFKAGDVLTEIINSSNEMELTREEESMPDVTREDIIREAEAEAEKILSEARKKAEIILAIAQRERESILRDAENRASKLMEEAKADGYRQGLQEGKNESIEKIEMAKQQADEILKKANDERNRIIDGLRDEILSLSLSISEKILRIELDRNEDAFKSIVMSAVKRASDSKNVKVRISESDYNKHFSQDENVSFINVGNINVAFVKDKLLTMGDCIVESDSGTIDAGISTQLKHIKLAFGVNA